jgi:uncharacterized membrane protein
MTGQIHLFEMRRLEALSNTIFGVAMTLLAYDLPRAAQFASAPDWTALVHAYSQKVLVLMISFMVAGFFWLTHHRRLAFAPEAGRGVVFLNLLFLMSIVILPATSSLYGAYRSDTVVAVVYGLHLTEIAVLSAILWFLALRGRDPHRDIQVAALFPIAIFLLGTAVAFVAPSASLFVWLLAFGAPLVGWLGTRLPERAVKRVDSQSS